MNAFTTHTICNACETVAHCAKNGCIPLTPQPANPSEDGWPKLTRSASLYENGGGTFGKGVSARLLVEAAYRHYENTLNERAKTPGQRQDDEMNRRALFDMIHGSPQLTTPLLAHMLDASKDRANDGTADQDELLEKLLDAADEWMAYVTEDTAPMTLRKYLEREIAAAKKGGA